MVIIRPGEAFSELQEMKVEVIKSRVIILTMIGGFTMKMNITAGWYLNNGVNQILVLPATLLYDFIRALLYFQLGQLAVSRKFPLLIIGLGPDHSNIFRIPFSG